ncbi:MAG: hypothetical protein AB4911_14055 [Oscillochloridaceae bacterium umkhey_bin13]
MARFALIASRGGPPPPGPWACEANPAVSFSLGAGAEPEPPRWCADLPADLAQAQADLAVAEADLARQEAALSLVPTRMALLQATAGAASFSLAQMDPAEQELLTLVQLPATEMLPADHEAMLTRFRAFVAQVQEAASNLAVVETRVNGRLLARTRVGWTGDLHHLSQPGLPVAQVQLHQRTLGLALGSRRTLIHSFGIVLRGAAIAGAMASSPLGAAMALPAAWRFVQQLLRE